MKAQGINSRISLRTRLSWALATTGGVAVGTLVALTPATALALAGAPAALVGLAGGAAIGGAVGVAQWLVLRRLVPAAGRWAPASLAGGMAGLALGLALAEAARPVVGAGPFGTAGARDAALAALAGGVAGVVLGGAQWLALHRPARRAAWWIAASGFGWLAGLGLASAVADMAGVLAGLLAGGSLVGAASGLALARLLPPDNPGAHRAGTRGWPARPSGSSSGGEPDRSEARASG